MGWFKTGKGVHQACILSPCLFNLYAEHIMWNARLDESSWNQDCQEKHQQHHADDTILMAESEEELKSLLIRVKKESAKAGLQLNFQKY